MALPSDTDWDFSYDEEDTTASAQIKTATPLIILQNQDYSLRRSRMLASHVFTPKATATAAPSWDPLFDSECVGPNILGSGVSSDIAGCVYAWTSNATTAFVVRVYNASYGTLTLTVAAGAAAQTIRWRGWMTGTFTAPGDDTIWGYTVDAQVTSGGGNVYVAGVGLFY